MAELNDTLTVKRPPSAPRTFSRPYWDATRDKKIMLQFDRRSGKYQFYPRANSIHTGRSGDLEWREASGRGEIFSFTVARRAREPFRGHEPFLIALVTLEEGVNVMANVVNCSLDEMKIGLQVKPYWHALPDGTNLLMFEPRRG
jgi:uncharacterized protein